jgi:hypothetical protein
LPPHRRNGLLESLALPLQNAVHTFKEGINLMSRISLSFLTVLASAMALSLLSASAQEQRAALDLSAPSSSSSSASATNEGSSLVISGTPAPAQPVQRTGARPFSGIGVGVKVGINGIGFDVATPLVRSWLNLRGGASFITYSPSTITTDSLNIDGTIKFQNADVMVDFFPFHGRFRLSGGITTYNSTGVTATLTIPTGQGFEVGGTTFYSQPYDPILNPAGPIRGTGTFTFGDNKIAPRVTIGTGNLLPRKGRFTFQSEIGIQYVAAPTVSYTLAGTGCLNYTAGVYSNCGPIPQSNISDQVQQIQSDLYDLRFFPIFSIGLGYRIH